VSPELLLRYAFGIACSKAAVLLRFQRSRDDVQDRWLLRANAPWLLDLPSWPSSLDVARRQERVFERAVCDLRLKGWLLLACDEVGQADLLAEATRQCGRLAVSVVGPAIAGLSEEGIGLHCLRKLDWEFRKCLL
jgi:hypothetical protein